MMQLPFNEKPIIKTWLPDAFACGIVTAKDDRYIPYLLSQYIQTILYDDLEKSGALQYMTIMHLENTMLTRDGLLSVRSLEVPLFACEANEIDFPAIAIDALCQGYYVYGIFDFYHVPQRLGYGQEHYDHEFLIYGYEKTTDSFFSAGYLDNNHFASSMIPAENFQKAMTVGHHPYYLKNYMMCYFSVNDLIQLDFNVAAVKSELENYLNSTGNLSMSNKYGAAAAEAFIQYMRESFHERQNVNISSIYNLKERTEIMTLRLEYMIKHGYIPYEKKMVMESDKITKLYETAVGLFLKYGITHNEVLLGRMCDILSTAKDRESILFENILRLID